MKIVVQASAVNRVPPQVARLRAAIRREGTDREEVVGEVTKTAAMVTDRLSQLHDAGQISVFQVRPLTTSSWVPFRGNKAPTRHTASVAWSADFTDFDSLADVTGAFAALPDVLLQPVEWRLSDDARDELEATTLQAAVAKARRRAQIIASAAGAGDVAFAKVSDPNTNRDSGFPMPRAAMAMAGARDSGGEPPSIEIVPEDVEVNVEIDATFTTGS